VGGSAYAINSLGDVTGYYLAPDGQAHAFIWDLFTPLRDMGTLGGPNSLGAAINHGGVVAGRSETADFHLRGIQTHRNAVAMLDIGTLGGADSEALGINDADMATGWASDTQGRRRAFIFDGVMNDVGTLGGTSSTGNDINSKRQITGVADLRGDAISHAFLYDPAVGPMRDLGTLGGRQSAGHAINEAGKVTGTALIANDAAQHAFFHNGTAMLDLGTLPTFAGSIGMAINNRDQITGTSFPQSGQSHAFLWEAGQMFDLNTLLDSSGTGWVLHEARGINDAGWIVGFGTFNGATPRPFLLTPAIPEPASALLMLGGLAALIAGLGRGAISGPLRALHARAQGCHST
jgi:probable HAF family extracellular repeat protein